MKAVLFGLILALGLCSACGGPAQPSEEDILAEYAKAQEAAGWFRVSTAPLDYEDMTEVNGMPYHRIRGFETYDDFTAHLGSLFGDALLDGWLDADAEMPMYVNVDGKVYGLDMARGTDIGKGEEAYEVIRRSGTEYILRVTVELLDYGIPDNMEATGEVVGYETHDFPYEYVDGDWVFTDFPEIR